MKLAIAGLVLCCGALTAAVKVPGFLARRDYPSAGGFVAVGDVTGDGIPDIVAVTSQDVVSTMPGNGKGTFGNAVNTAVQWLHMSGAALADLNGDGKMDLVIGGSPGAVGDGGIGVLFSNGDGTFPQPVFYEVNDGALSNAVVGDFNGDGIPDVAAGGTKGVWLFRGKGDGTFHAGFLAAETPSQAAWSGAADFNGDGKLDLAVTTYPSGVYMLFGNGNGTFKKPVMLGTTDSGYLAVGEVTRSGHPDIVVPSGPATVSASVYINNGKGSFGTPIQVPLSGFSVAIGDVNGDGIPDLVGGSGCVALGLGLAKFAPETCYPVANTMGTSQGVVLAELTTGKAGFNDIISGLNGSVTVLINWGNGKFVDGLWVPVAGSGNCGVSADFNGDGKPDLGVPTGNGIVVLLGTGKALEPYSTGLTVPLSGPGCPITGDVNGDGIADILEGANSLGGVGVYLGKGDGTFVLASVIPFGSNTDMVLGDFNHDGKPDIATSSNQMAFGNGDGTFQPPVSILDPVPPPGYMSWLAAGDINNDGWTDLIYVAGIDGGGLYILLNNQQGGFTLSTTHDTNGSSALMLADVNGDGRLDAIEASEGAYAAIYLGNGQGGFTPGQTNIPYPFVDQLPAQTADVNGDGVLDLLLPANGSIGIALGMGNGTFYAPFVVGAGPDLGQVFAQSLHGQSPGFPDLVAPDSSGGVTVLLNLTQ